MSSPTSVATPLSLDTAYSSIWQDTPCSLRLTPVSLGTPHTPCFSATPLSQDSCYSSLQATPVLQGETFASTVHKSLRRERRLRKPARRHRGFGKVTDVTLYSRHLQPAHTPSSQRLEQWRRNANAASSPYSNKDRSFRDDQDALASNTLSLTILKIKAMAHESSASPRPLTDHTSRRKSFVPVAERSDSPQQHPESLDSRIESLLVTCQNSNSSHFDEATFATDFPSQDSPASAIGAGSSILTDRSLDWPPVAPASLFEYDDLSSVEPALPDENEEDETQQAVSFLQSNLQSPASEDFLRAEMKSHTSTENDAAVRFQQLSQPTVVSLQTTRIPFLFRLFKP